MRDGWQEVEIRDVVSLNPESVSKKTPPGEIQYIDIAAVSATGVDSSAIRTLAYANAPSRAQRYLRGGDTMVSTVRPYLRARAFVGPKLDGHVASTGFCVLRPTERIVAGYLDAVTSTDDFYAHLESRQTGSAYPAVRPEDIGEMRVPLPPIDEQRRIADVLEALDALRADAMVETAAAATVAKRLRARLLGDEEFDRVRLADAVDITMGRQRSPKHQTGDHIVPYIRAANIKDGFLALDDVLRMNFTPAEQRKFQLMPGDVLVTEGCGSLSQIGANAVWRAQISETVCFQNTVLRLRAVEGRTIAGFVAHWARHAFDSGAFAATSFGTSIFHIGAERAAEMLFPLVTAERQKVITRLLDAAENSAQATEMRVESLGAVRAALLSALLSGEHVIPGSYDRFLAEVA